MGAFLQILDRLTSIERSLSEIRCELTKRTIQVNEKELNILPDHLRKTYLAASSRDEITATEVSKLTGRSRASESSYLLQLVDRNLLTRSMNGRTAVFSKPGW